jgi:hypothetical protein
MLRKGLFMSPKYFVIAITTVFFIMFSSYSFGGTPSYPPIVYADEHGIWTVTIIVTGTDNPDFQIENLVNTYLWEHQITHRPDGSWIIVLHGRLRPGAESGYIEFTVDPEGQFVDGKITIYSADHPIPTLSEYGTIALVLLIISAAVWVQMKRRARL